MGGLAGWARRRALLAGTVAAVAAPLAIWASPAAPANDWTFVQVQRVNSLTLEFGTDTYATHNAFGGAFAGSAAQTSMQSALDSAVADGSISWLFEMPGLTDLSGTNNAAFDVGVVDASPIEPAGNPATYSGSSDLDWWYSADPADLQPDGSATHKLTATFSAKTLNAGPGPVALTLIFAGQVGALAISNTNVQAVAGDSSAPLKSTNGYPPGHQPGENLPDSLTSFGSMSSGKLTGGISAGSLANTLIPPSLVGSACAENYSSSNTMLDLIVKGCKAFGGFVTEIKATQPDTFDPAVGSGTYVFTTDSSNHVTSCTHDGNAATLSDCLAQAAYSSYVQFTTDRVIDRAQVTVGKLLTVTKSGAGSGSVTSSPAGIDCGSDCVEGYAPGSQVTLTATPSAGSSFDAWTGCDQPSGATCVMTMDADKPVTASFVQQTSTGTGDGSTTTGGTSGAGGATPAGGATTTPAAADKTAPVFGATSISPHKVRKRAAVSFTLSEAAQVTFIFESVAPGRRAAAKCVKATRGNARKRRCNRFVPVARQTVAALAGANRQAFATRIGKRTLKPGVYRLTLLATDAAGNRSQPKRLTFVVVKRA